MNIKLEKLKSNEPFCFIELETGCEIKDVWSISINGIGFNLSSIVKYMRTTPEIKSLIIKGFINSIVKYIRTNPEEYISLLYKYGANCYYKYDKRDNKSNLYFSNHKTALKALKAVEALAIMNKLLE